MKQLKDILYKVHIEAVHGATDVVVSKIEFDFNPKNFHLPYNTFSVTMKLSIAKKSLNKKK